ncbi:hypothetical protein T01_5318 [Trichinella spiralis]|uniref:Uncharacterized protein n=1 Tax=Trichinella spiralis TaxID=6334 RepID=A0A0V0Z1X4_TRISP|nr:hypothetical protein T01_5318 [Trichinella spiralis]
MPSFRFPREPNKMVNLINRYNFPIAATNSLPFHGFPMNVHIAASLFSRSSVMEERK